MATIGPQITKPTRRGKLQREVILKLVSSSCLIWRPVVLTLHGLVLHGDIPSASWYRFASFPIRLLSFETAETTDSPSFWERIVYTGIVPGLSCISASRIAQRTYFLIALLILSSGLVRRILQSLTCPPRENKPRRDLMAIGSKDTNQPSYSMKENDKVALNLP